ncbi:ParA family protein [Rhodococcus opacus]|uniref:ParA family protein n=1 Tax=Rhodococcus opacus TaxID=37919 RepID=A0A2S8IW41_RHOOP|nr:ParA family protein [Rhodococcus opacus]PQP18997.1 ParA family protein [Rhodococcus opacus]
MPPPRTHVVPQRDAVALHRVISLLNGKGGVFKTTLASNLSGLLAESGYRVLLNDLDPQGNIAEDLGYTYTDIDDEGKNLAQALSFGDPLTPVRDVRPNLDVIPGGAHLSMATAALAAKATKDPLGAKLALATALAPIAGEYDMVIIDCPPGDDTLQTAAAAASKWLLVPTKTDGSSRKGMSAIAARLSAVLDVNEDLDLLGVVLCGVGANSTSVQRTAREGIVEAFGGDVARDVVFENMVRHSEATGLAVRERGVLVHELDDVVQSGPKWYEVVRGEAKAQAHAPKSAKDVAADLLGVCQEMVQRITKAETEEAAAS